MAVKIHDEIEILMEQFTGRVGSLSIEDYVRHWYSEIMALIIFACRKKAKRRQQLPYFFSSHTVHLLNKPRTASRHNNNNLRLSSLQYDIGQSVELDKTCFFESFSEFNS